MDQLPGILLHVDLVDTDLFLPGLGLDLHIAVMADRQIELGDLIVLGVVRVKIIFPIELAVLVDLTVCGQPYSQGVLHHLLI